MSEFYILRSGADPRQGFMLQDATYYAQNVKTEYPRYIDSYLRAIPLMSEGNDFSIARLSGTRRPTPKYLKIF